MLELVGDDAYSLNPETDSFFRPLPDDGWKKDWSKTASHMRAMKGVVTVDTGTAHLAGALGVKTIVLLPKPEFVCWRWKNARWYDSVIALPQDEYHRVPELIARM
jgi:ADP-heptose:LPS heptosyltransferase